MKKMENAIRVGSIQGVQLALKDGVDINQSVYSDDHASPLRIAVNFKRPDIVKKLLVEGALVDNNYKMWRSAIRNVYSTDIFEYMIDSLRDQLSTSSNAPLEGSALTVALWEYLQPSGSLDSAEFSFIDDVAVYGSPAMLSRMLFHGIPVNTSNEPAGVIYKLLKNWGGYEPTHPHHYEQFNIEKVRLLILAGANMHPIPGELSSLQIAIDICQGLRCDLVRLILETRTCDINIEYFVHGSQYGTLRRGLMLQPRPVFVQNICRFISNPCNDNRVATLVTLLEQGADFTKMWRGLSPLFLALERELKHEYSPQVSVLDALLEHMTVEQVQMPATSDFQSLVLQTLQPGNSRPRTLEKLLAAGADQNTVDGPTGVTPLYYLMSRLLEQNEVDNEEQQLILILIQSPGLDFFKKIRDGVTVLDLVNGRIADWNMGIEIYTIFHRIVTENYQIARECFSMALHKNVGPDSSVAILPPDIITSILDRKHYFLIPDVDDVFG